MLRLTCRQRHQFNDPDYARAALWSSILELDGQAIQATQAGLAQIGDATLKTLYFTRHFPNITSSCPKQVLVHRSLLTQYLRHASETIRHCGQQCPLGPGLRCPPTPRLVRTDRQFEFATA